MNDQQDDNYDKTFDWLTLGTDTGRLISRPVSFQNPPELQHSERAASRVFGQAAQFILDFHQSVVFGNAIGTA
jgi:hypothetical protein